MITAERTYTIAELWALSHDPAYADKRLELSQGRLIVKSPAGWEHGDIAAELGLLIRAYVKQHNFGRTTTAETGYILHQSDEPDGKETMRAPDVGFIPAAKIPDQLPKGFVPFAPDLAVEVISPSETATEIQVKVQEYLEYGTRMVVLVYPDLKSIVVYTPTSHQILKIDDTFDGGDVLPGFKLPLRALFEG